MPKGILKRWDDEKGFGFIQTEDGGADIFLHISSIKRTERRPVIGDTVYFDQALDEKGRLRAAHASLEDNKSVFNERTEGRRTSHRAGTASAAKRPRSRPASRANFFANGVNLVLIMAGIGLFSFAYDKLQSSEAVEKPAAEIGIEDIAPKFECAGKTRCREMTSCEEAMFYLANCPGTLADGDRDGKPCEDQWCGH
jgi:cold shock CspA family protein